MSGICSAHQHYQPGCKLCEAGRGEEMKEQHPELVCSLCSKQPVVITWYEGLDGKLKASTTKLCRKCQLKASVENWVEKAYEKYPFMKQEE